MNRTGKQINPRLMTKKEQIVKVTFITVGGKTATPSKRMRPRRHLAVMR